MKKVLILAWIGLSTTLLIGGGNNNSNISSVIDVPKVCKTDRVYIEKDTSLMWQDQAYTDAEDGAYKNNRSVSKAGTLNHAKNYCRSLNYAGYSDWRLPTSDELIYIHKKHGQTFTYFRGDDFWSSTPTKENKYYVVYPADAYPYERKKTEVNYIRCVRCLGLPPKETKSAEKIETASTDTQAKPLPKVQIIPPN